MKQNPWTSFDPLGLEETKSGAKVTRKRHYVVPVATWGKNGLSKEVQESLNKARIGPDGVEHGGVSHREYNKRADKLVGDYVDAAKARGIDPSGLSGKEAREFFDGLVKSFDNTNDAYIRGFNAEVKAGKSQAQLAQWGACNEAGGR